MSRRIFLPLSTTTNPLIFFRLPHVVRKPLRVLAVLILLMPSNFRTRDWPTFADSKFFKKISKNVHKIFKKNSKIFQKNSKSFPKIFDFFLLSSLTDINLLL